MPLTPEDVRNKQFTTVRLREGYDEEEVDAFLDEVETELTRLIRENDELRAKLAAATRAQAAQPTAAQRRPEPEPERPAPPPPPAPTPPPPQPPPPQPVPQAQQQQGEGSEAAVRMLAMAQKTADDAISEARREADRVITEARQKADQIEREARAKAESLEREAQDRHRQVMGSLEHQRDDLERRVEELRTFEREYRSRLKSYLETQLRELEGRNASPGQPVRAGQGRGNPFAPGAAMAHGGDNASGAGFSEHR
ncbi:MAG: DivIVA domain-containing protein [Actinomycetes bacterium]